MPSDGVRRVTNDELNAILRRVKRNVPDGAVCALFVFQDGGQHGLATDYVSNTDTRDLAKALIQWATMVLAGDLPVERDPHGGES